MNETQLLNRLFYQGLNTAIAAVVIIVIAIIVFTVLKRKVTSEKKALKLRSRVIYIAAVIFLLAIVRIWIEGFTHLFTMLSLVGAALVIINKENIMNFTGWIIINWRGLFSEDDTIQVQGYRGNVKDIKVLYFTLYETIESANDQPTGKLIKVPNAVIITNPIITLTNDHSLILHQVPFVVSIDAEPIDIALQAKQTITNLLQQKYQCDQQLSESSLISKYSLSRLRLKSLTPQVNLKFFNDKENIVNVQTSFYCYAEDVQALEQDFIQSLLTHTRTYNKYNN